MCPDQKQPGRCLWGTASPGSAAGCSESIRDRREEQGSGIENTHRHPNKYIRVILQVQGSHWNTDVATCSWTSSGRFFSPPAELWSPGKAQVADGQNPLCLTPVLPDRLPLQALHCRLLPLRMFFFQ